MEFSLLAPFVIAFIMNAECLTDAEQKMIMAIHEGCMPISGATNEMAQRAMVGDFPEDMEFKKHMLCMSSTMGFMDAAGNFKMDFINMQMDKRIPDPGLRAEILSKCVVAKETPEETAFASTKCMYAYKDNFD